MTYEGFVTRATARMNEQGRLVIPAEVRQAAGLEPNTDVIVEAVGKGEVRIHSAATVLQRIQAKYRARIPEDANLVDELIAERRAEAARE